MLYFFVNPASRSGTGAEKWYQVQPILTEKQVPYQVHFLSNEPFPRAIMEDIFAKEEGTVSIIIIGGDGTINQCVNTIPDFTRAELSVLPTGSGNDFCRNKEIPKSLEEQIDNIINKKNTRMVDRGVITYTLTTKETISRISGDFLFIRDDRRPAEALLYFLQFLQA